MLNNLMAFKVFGLLLGLLLSANVGAAASVDSFARVNLVQGVEASVGLLNPEKEASSGGGEFNLIGLSGPANYCVEVQMVVLPVKSSWEAQISSGEFKLATSHDSLGNLDLDLPFALATANKLLVNDERYIVTLTYE